ncbi:MAG: hypothetical protein RLZZ565_1208 [Planctomycetota bacterium]
MITLRHGAACGTLLIASAAAAQISFNGSYTQSFDGLGQTGAVTLTGRGPHALEGVLGATGVDGWFGANFLGSSLNTEFKAQDGSLASSAGRGVISFGPDGSSERALGALPTSNQISSFGVVLVNDTAETFAAIDLAFVGEQWRAGGADIPNALLFRFGYGGSLEDATEPIASFDFLAPNLSGGEVAIDGNDPANQSSIDGTLGGLVWAPGESIVLRWDMTEFSGQDNGLAIDDLSVLGIPGITSLDLGGYGLAAIHPLPPVAAAEASAVTWNWDTDTLFVLGDEGEAIVEVSKTGAELSVMTLTGFSDTEGLTYLGNGRFVVAEERIQDVFLVEYVAGGSVDRSAVPGVSLGDTVGNIGLEGISYDPLSDTYITVKEKSPQAVQQAVIDWSVPFGAAGDLFTPKLGVLDLSDVQVLSTVPTLAGTTAGENLLIYSQESSLLMQVTRSGELVDSFSFAGIAGDAEGVTIDSLGTIFIVGETPSLYVLRPLDPKACPPDLNGDGTVNGADLSVLLSQWGGPGSADFDFSGSVGGADLAVLLGAWGDC